MENKQNNSKKAFWTGSVLKWLCSIFLLFDAIMKIIKESHYVEGTKELGLPENSIQILGLYLLLSTVLYLVPRTVILGGLMLTAYLGAAAAITIRAQQAGHPYLFPIIFAVVIWAAEYLKNEKTRRIVPFLL